MINCNIDENVLQLSLIVNRLNYKRMNIYLRLETAIGLQNESFQ